jgi:uncharacterized protein YndB with AHSA1/START domain
MITDPIATAGLVAREVRTGSRDGAPTRIVVARRTYATDQADLWDAVTSSERVARWFAPVSGDLRIGGRYQVEGNAGGIVERCEQPSSFAVTWEYGPMMSWLDVTLTPAADGTTLQVTHEAPVDPTFWAEYGPGATGVGWDLAFMGLGLFLESGASFEPVDENEFVTSSQGIAFVQQVAGGWAEAAVASGDHPEQARAAAERTVTFYTVVSEDAPEA